MPSHYPAVSGKWFDAIAELVHTLLFLKRVDRRSIQPTMQRDDAPLPHQLKQPPLPSRPAAELASPPLRQAEYLSASANPLSPRAANGADAACHPPHRLVGAPECRAGRRIGVHEDVTP